MSGAGEAVETHVILVRHGQSEGNAQRRFGGHGPTPLSDLGHAQARATGAVVADRFAPDLVVCSDLVRAVQTAEYIARAAGGLDIEQTPDLRERGLGRMDGLKFTEAKERYPDDWARLIARDPDWASPGGGETSRSAFARVGRGIDGIVERHAGKTVVVVSHGIAIYLAFAHICGLDPFRDETRVFIRVDNCSITHAVWREGIWRFDALNDTHHIEE